MGYIYCLRQLRESLDYAGFSSHFPGMLYGALPAVRAGATQYLARVSAYLTRTACPEPTAASCAVYVAYLAPISSHCPKHIPWMRGAQASPPVAPSRCPSTDGSGIRTSCSCEAKATWAMAFEGAS